MGKKVFEENILNIGNGMILELVDVELKKTLTNLVDPNTDYKKMRKITLELKFKQNEEQNSRIKIFIVNFKN